MGLYKIYYSQKNWNKANILDFYKDIWREKKINFLWKIDKEKVKNDLLGLLDKGEDISFSTLCKTVYENYISVNEKATPQLIIDKNPIYTLFTDELLNIYPDTKFILMIRDYRDVIFSAKRNNIHKIGRAHV